MVRKRDEQMRETNSLRSKFAIGAFLIGITMATASALLAYDGGKAILVETISNQLASHGMPRDIMWKVISGSY